MSKLTILFTIALLLSFTLTYASRPGSLFVSSEETQQEVGEAENVEVDENCDGVGKDECLMRRTLAAHIDYIYTQNHTHKNNTP